LLNDQVVATCSLIGFALAVGAAQAAARGNVPALATAGDTPTARAPAPMRVGEFVEVWCATRVGHRVSTQVRDRQILRVCQEGREQLGRVHL